MKRSFGIQTWMRVTLLSFIPAISMAQADTVDVQIRLAKPDALEISYTLPEQCKELAFLKNGDEGKQIRAHWIAQDDCGAMTGNTLTRRTNSCPILHFTVPTTTETFHSYPAAFPLTGGIYTHTSNYAVADSCGAVHYHFLAPGIATAGHTYTERADADEKNGADTPALLMQAPMAKTVGTISYFDPRLSSAAVAQIREVADRTVSHLQAALPNAAFHPPILAATWATAPGGPNIGGNASDVLLLSFFNWPERPGPDEKKKMTLLVAHEFSHRFQLRDAVDSYPDARLIHEGGAEFLRWLTSIDEGWLSREDAAADLDDALTQCILYTDGQAWRALKPNVIAGNRLEYRCGLAAYVYGLTARQGKASAYARIDDFYKELKSGATPDFYHAMECGDDATCQAHWLPLVLGADASMEDQWRQFFAATSLAKPHPPNAQQRDAMTLQAVVKLMKDDCDGHRSTTQTPDGVLIDGMSVCKTLRSDMHVTKIEGHAVFGQQATLPAMIAACETRHAVTLASQNGDTVTVPCKEPYLAHARFYDVDIDKVLALLR